MLKLSEERIVPVCGLDTATKINKPSDLAHCDKIHVLGFDDHWARYFTAFDLNHDVSSPHLIVDTSLAACELAAAESGCAIMIERFAQQAIETGRPIKIVGNPVTIGQSHYVARRNSRPEGKQASAAFCSWLETCFED